MTTIIRRKAEQGELETLDDYKKALTNLWTTVYGLRTENNKLVEKIRILTMTLDNVKRAVEELNDGLH